MSKFTRSQGEKITDFGMVDLNMKANMGQVLGFQVSVLQKDHASPAKLEISEGRAPLDASCDWRLMFELTDLRPM